MINKPDWKNAPKWANWLAQDHDGQWYWFETEPELNNGTWMPNMPRHEFAEITEEKDFMHSLEQRP